MSIPSDFERNQWSNLPNRKASSRHKKVRDNRPTTSKTTNFSVSQKPLGKQIPESRTVEGPFKKRKPYKWKSKRSEVRTADTKASSLGLTSFKLTKTRNFKTLSGQKGPELRTADVPFKKLKPYTPKSKISEDRPMDKKAFSSVAAPWKPTKTMTYKVSKKLFGKKGPELRMVDVPFKKPKPYKSTSKISEGRPIDKPSGATSVKLNKTKNFTVSETILSQQRSELPALKSPEKKEERYEPKSKISEGRPNDQTTASAGNSSLKSTKNMKIDVRGAKKKKSWDHVSRMIQMYKSTVWRPTPKELYKTNYFTDFFDAYPAFRRILKQDQMAIIILYFQLSRKNTKISIIQSNEAIHLKVIRTIDATTPLYGEVAVFNLEKRLEGLRFLPQTVSFNELYIQKYAILAKLKTFITYYSQKWASETFLNWSHPKTYYFLHKYNVPYDYLKTFNFDDLTQAFRLPKRKFVRRYERLLTCFTAGMLRLVGKRRSTPFAAREITSKAIRYIRKHDFVYVRVFFRGVSANRTYIIRTLFSTSYFGSALKILSLADITSAPYNGCRPKKYRRR
uniref:Small ribosomal subunit protein uS11c n=1 Tax=Chromera velia TaxID=505693 RepID=D9IXD9_9ALVE|nr:ribosomal protein S11 [Chromera velia]ADJ66547.1 ribosomal protein S11 [Chromera velia]